MSIREMLVLASASLLAACGGIDPSAECVEAEGEEYVPLVEGAEWTYGFTNAVTDVYLGEKSHRIVEKLSDNEVKVQNTGNGNPGLRWLRRDGSRYVWTRNFYPDEGTQKASDQYYDPPALRFDACRRTVDDTWEEQHTKTEIDVASCPGWSEALEKAEVLSLCPDAAITREQVEETWQVFAIDEQLSDVRRRLGSNPSAGGVPAGDFEVTCHQRMCPGGGCNPGTRCYARGVGKVFEISTEQEELETFSIPPQ